MIAHRPYEALGRIERDWLDARLHFRFGDIGPAHHVSLGPLHIWNDDTFAPRSGFGMHAHANVEIVTFVRAGTVTHEDDMGHIGHIDAGCVQVMSAGRGVRHAERNEADVPLQLFQIWLTPRTQNREPRWAMRQCDLAGRPGQWIVLVSGDADDVQTGALRVDADARLLAATMRSGASLAYALRASRQAYLVTTAGRLRVNGQVLRPRDGAAIVDEERLDVHAIDDTVIVVVDVPAVV